MTHARDNDEARMKETSFSAAWVFVPRPTLHIPKVRSIEDSAAMCNLPSSDQVSQPFEQLVDHFLRVRGENGHPQRTLGA